MKILKIIKYEFLIIKRIFVIRIFLNIKVIIFDFIRSFTDCGFFHGLSGKAFAYNVKKLSEG